MREVCGLLTQRENRVLLVYKNYHWFFPGGKREEEETHEQTLRRELFKELRLEVEGTVALLHSGTFPSPEGEEFRYTVFTCAGGQVKGNPRLNPQDTVKDFAWVDRPLELNLTDHARFILKRYYNHKWAA